MASKPNLTEEMLLEAIPTEMLFRRSYCIILEYKIILANCPQIKFRSEKLSINNSIIVRHYKIHCNEICW